MFPLEINGLEPTTALDCGFINSPPNFQNEQAGVAFLSERSMDYTGEQVVGGSDWEAGEDVAKSGGYFDGCFWEVELLLFSFLPKGM